MTDFMYNYASWILALSGTAAMFVIGRKKRWGWLWFIFNECMWVGYALTTKQYGFIFGSITYGAVAVKSYKHWKDLDITKISWSSFLKLVWEENK